MYIHYMDKSTGTPPSLEEKKGTYKLWQTVATKMETINLLENVHFHLCYNSFEVYKMTVPI